VVSPPALLRFLPPLDRDERDRVPRVVDPDEEEKQNRRPDREKRGLRIERE
jgi:hypothetical protein